MPLGDMFATLPDPGPADTVDDLVERLRRLKVWAGDPSYETIKERVNAAWTAAGRPAAELTRRTTVADCFRAGRRRLDAELVAAVVHALHPDTGYVAQWRQVLRVVGGETEPTAQVRVQDGLPPDLAGFTGRAAELRQLHAALRTGGSVVISAIEGMAGVGKTQLAVHAGHLLHAEQPFERVLFVNLRGFHPDPAQPPADPAAVLDGFLRLLGVPGHQVPPGLHERAALYRDRLTGRRALVVLDNAGTAEQVRPLLPATPGCLGLVTSRHSLAALDPATRLTVDVFTAAEAADYLTRAVPGVPVGADPDAAARIARRCGYLPLALGLVTGHIRRTPGWTLTDHADRLDEQHLDGGVELAFDLSYRNLPADRRMLLRLAALHPGQDFDAYAAAALAGIDLATADDRLHRLRAGHLLQQAAPGRYTLHDLVRAYAATRAQDEDRPAARRAALTRLFDHYLATTGTAMSTLNPAEDHWRPAIPPVDTPVPQLTDLDTARGWLDTERPTLVAVAAHTAAHGWPTHATRLARTLARYLNGGHHSDAVVVYRHAYDAARQSGDPAGQAHALTDLGIAHWWLGRPDPGIGHLRQALALFQQTGDPAGQARVLNNLGTMTERLGRYREAVEHYRRGVQLNRQAGERAGEVRTLNNLGVIEARLGHFEAALRAYRQALLIVRQDGDRAGEAGALNGLGTVQLRRGDHEPAGEHLRQALALYRQLGHRLGEADTLDHLGLLQTRLGRPEQGAELSRRALAICRETGERNGQAWTLNSLGEAAYAAGRPADAVTHHEAALTIALDLGDRLQQARAHAGLGEASGELEHYRRAVALYTELGMPEAATVRARLG